MVRRGQCRCGSVLDFEEGPDGYKTRCPSCGSVVRLNPTSTRSKKRSKEKSTRHDRPARDVPAAARRAPSPLVERAGRAVTCELCHTLVPVEALQCPGCGSSLAVTTAVPILENGPSSPRHATVANFPIRPIVCWLIAGAVVIAVVATVLLLQH